MPKNAGFEKIKIKPNNNGRFLFGKCNPATAASLPALVQNYAPISQYAGTPLGPGDS